MDPSASSIEIAQFGKLHQRSQELSNRPISNAKALSCSTTLLGYLNRLEVAGNAFEGLE
jgi:hypothetical protein